MSSGSQIVNSASLSTDTELDCEMYELIFSLNCENNESTSHCTESESLETPSWVR